MGRDKSWNCLSGIRISQSTTSREQASHASRACCLHFSSSRVNLPRSITDSPCLCLRHTMQWCCVPAGV